MDKDELRKQICKMEKQVEIARRKRNAITITAFAIVFFLIFYLDERPDGFWDVIGCIAVAIIMAGLHFLINAAVFGGLYIQTESERKLLEQLKKELEEKEDP